MCVLHGFYDDLRIQFPQVLTLSKLSFITPTPPLLPIDVNPHTVVVIQARQLAVVDGHDDEDTRLWAIVWTEKLLVNEGFGFAP